MGIDILLRLVISLEVASGLIAISLFPLNPDENWQGLIAAAIFIFFLYYVFHIPLKKKVKSNEQEDS